jgi:chemotaxis protein methyltransferase CheR
MSAPLTDHAYTQFRDLLLAHTGLDFPPQRRTDLSMWLWRAIDMIRDVTRSRPKPESPPTTLEMLYEILQSGDSLAWEKVIDAVTIGETHFFRSAEQYEALRDTILPPLITRRRKTGSRTLRIWSAGCATGEEPYSVAMLLREMLPDVDQWHLSIIGTDINKGMIAQAGAGVYHDWSFREEYAIYARATYFTRQDNRYQLNDKVRAMVRFEAASVLDRCRHQPDYLRQLDVILCRNVVLYFGGQVRRWVYQQLLEMLRPGGWLLVGHADPPPPNFAAFEVYNLRGTTAYRKPGEGAPLRVEPPVTLLPREQTAQGTDASGLEEEAEPEEEDAPRSAAEQEYRLGRWHADRQQWPDALYHCQRAIALQPTCTEAYYTLALIHQALNETDRAIEALRRATYLRHDWPLPRFTLAGLYRFTGQCDRARRELRNVVALTNHLAPDAPIKGADGLTAARLREAAQRQLASLPEDPAGPC